MLCSIIDSEAFKCRRCIRSPLIPRALLYLKYIRRQAVCDGLPRLDDAQLEVLVVGGQGLQLGANYTPEIVP